jgi:hypothetical protein
MAVTLTFEFHLSAGPAPLTSSRLRAAPGRAPTAPQRLWHPPDVSEYMSATVSKLTLGRLQATCLGYGDGGG